MVLGGTGGSRAGCTQLAGEAWRRLHRPAVEGDWTAGTIQVMAVAPTCALLCKLHWPVGQPQLQSAAFTSCGSGTHRKPHLCPHRGKGPWSFVIRSGRGIVEPCAQGPSQLQGSLGRGLAHPE